MDGGVLEGDFESHVECKIIEVGEKVNFCSTSTVGLVVECIFFLLL